MKNRMFKILALVITLSMLLPVAALAKVPAAESQVSTRVAQPAAEELVFEPVSVDQVTPVSGRVLGEEKGETEPAIYFVVLEDAPLVSYRGGIEGLAATNPSVRGEQKLNAKSPESLAYLDYLAGKRAEVIARANQAIGHTLDVTYEYKITLNGFAAHMSPAEASQIAGLPGIWFVERETEHFLDTDAGPAWMGAPGVWDGSATGELPGTYGEGVIVGVIDTGIDPWNPSFLDIGDDGYDHDNPWGSGNYVGVCDPADPTYDPTFPCNDKLIGAWGYTSVQGGDPRDSNGHGSHTASTAAGNFVYDAVVETPSGAYYADISGVAPHANVVMYAACCTSDALAAAKDQIVLDGVDVVNYSIGSSAPTGDLWASVDTLQWLAARDAGIFVATSAGNAGPGDATLNSPGDAPWMTTVGASSHNRAFLNSLVLDGGALTVDGQGMTGPLVDPAPVVFAADYPPYGEDARLCADGVFAPGTFSGEVVICERGEYGRVAKGQTVLDGGAGGYILAQPDEFGGGPGAIVSDPHVLPAVHIDWYKYQDLQAYLAANPGATGTISGAVLDLDDAHGDIMASFSSRGPNGSVADFIKPNVTAPGRSIWAAYHQGAGGDGDYTWNVIQGTSMSSPHMAGAGALMAALHPDWTPAEIESALMTTARDTVLDTDGINTATPFGQGAGHPDLSLAGQAGLLLDVTTAEFEDADPKIGGVPRELNLASLGNSQCVGVCSWTREVWSPLDYTVTWTAMVTGAEGLALTVTPDVFEIPPGGSQEILVEADAFGLTPDEWAFGAVTLEPMVVLEDETPPAAHFPVAVVFSAGSFPDEVVINTRRDAGSWFIPDLQAVEIPTMTIESFGLAFPDIDEFELYEDPTNDIPEGFYDDLDQVFWKTMYVPAGTARLVAQILDTTSPDLDMAVGLDTNGDGLPSLDEQVCQSATGSWNEYCNILWPEGGTWWVVVMNWQESANAPDSVVLATAAVSSDWGNMWFDAPESVPAGELFDITLFFDEPDLEYGDHLYGAFSLGTDPDNPGNIGTVPVDLVRHHDDVVKHADPPAAMEGWVVTYTVTIQPNISMDNLTYWLTDTLPMSSTYVEGSAWASTGEVEVIDGILYWTGVQPIPGYLYQVSTSLDDVDCTFPLSYADDNPADNYTNLAAWGYYANAEIFGDEVAFQDASYGGGPYEFYGDPRETTLYFTDDGIVSLDIDSVLNTPYVNAPIPSAGLPDALMAALWNDMEIVYQEGTGESNRGVTTGIYLTTGGVPSAKLLEFDDLQLVGDPSSQIDFEVLIREAIGADYEIVFAYDNITGDFADLTVASIGVENWDGDQGTQYAYDDANLQTLEDGMAICFNAVLGGDSIEITYQVTVDEGTLGQTLVNEVAHVTDDPGAVEEYTDYGLQIRTDPEPLLCNGPAVGFENAEALPIGWMAFSNGEGWMAGSDLSSDYWTIPPHTIYAASNDDGAGSGNDGGMDYLGPPPLDLTSWTEAFLTFESFYTGAYSQLAFVEVSTDGGETWEQVMQLDSADDWTTVSVDLSGYAGMSDVRVAFHADDDGSWASGWAIDDIALDCSSLPDAEWYKEIFINDQGPFMPGEPFMVLPGDTVEVVDYVEVLWSEPISYTLMENWTESLILVDYYAEFGEVVQEDPGVLVWYMDAAAPGVPYILSKTFVVNGQAGFEDYLYEYLILEGGNEYEIPLEFYIPVTLSKYGPEEAEVGEIIYYDLVVRTPAGINGDAFLSDFLPAGVEYVPDTVSTTFGTAWYDEVDNAIYWTNVPPLQSYGDSVAVPAAGPATVKVADQPIEKYAEPSAAPDILAPHGIITVLEEGFEDGLMPPDGWTVIESPSATRHWQLVDATTYPDWIHTGEYAGWVNYEAADQDEWLISPLINLAGLGDPIVEFWVYANNNWIDGAELQFLVLDGEGAFEDTLWVQSDEDWPYPSEYHQLQVDLSAYTAAPVFLAWRYVGNDGDSIALDDILVTGDGEPIPAEAWISFDVQVTAEPGSHVTNMADMSYDDLMLHAETTLQVTSAYGVALSDDTHEMGEAGELVRHWFEATNTGSFPDSFALDIGDETWPTSQSDLNTGMLNPGESFEFFVDVQIPSTESIVDSDTFRVFANSDSGNAYAEAYGTTDWVECDVTFLIDPAEMEVRFTEGDFDVDVLVADVLNFGGFDAELHYDPAVVHIEDFVLGPFPGSTGNICSTLLDIDNVAGVTSIGVFCLGEYPGPDGSGSVGIVTLSPQTEDGETVLDLRELQATDMEAVPYETVCDQDGYVIVTPCYWADFDCDGDVDIVDIMQVAARWNCDLGDPCYDALYDVDDDGDIDIVDIMMVAAEWGWEEPE